MEANLGGEERRGNKQGAGNRAIRPRLTLTTKGRVGAVLPGTCAREGVKGLDAEGHNESQGSSKSRETGKAVSPWGVGSRKRAGSSWIALSSL